MTRKPLGVRVLNASVDQDPNSRLTGSGRAMNFLTFQGLLQSCCGFMLPLTPTAADLLTSGVLGCSPHLGQDDNCSVSFSQEPPYNQKLADLREASVPSKNFTWNIRARNWDPNLLRPNRVFYHSRAESAGNKRHFVVFHTEPQLEPRRAHTICRCILDCNEPFF